MQSSGNANYIISESARKKKQFLLLTRMKQVEIEGLARLEHRSRYIVVSVCHFVVWIQVDSHKLNKYMKSTEHIYVVALRISHIGILYSVITTLTVRYLMSTEIEILSN